MSSRHGLSARGADAGEVDGLMELLKSADQPIARDRLVACLAALQTEATPTVF